MDILGVGGWELVAILLIMLVVAGPKRMIAWSYTLGTYVAKLRKMWAETAKMLQKEFDEAGVDVKVPTDIPTRATLNQEITRAFAPVAKPIQETLDATKKELDTATKELDKTRKQMSYPLPMPDQAKPAATETTPPAEAQPPATETAPAPSIQPTPSANPAPSSNGHADFGTWSQKPTNGDTQT